MSRWRLVIVKIKAGTEYLILFFFYCFFFNPSFVSWVVLFHFVALAYPEAWKIWQEEETDCKWAMSSGAAGTSRRKDPQRQDVFMCRINEREQQTLCGSRALFWNRKQMASMITVCCLSVTPRGRIWRARSDANATVYPSDAMMCVTF